MIQNNVIENGSILLNELTFFVTTAITITIVKLLANFRYMS